MNYLVDVRYAKLMEMRRENVNCSSVVPNGVGSGRVRNFSELSLSLFLFFSLSFSLSFNSQGGEGGQGGGKVIQKSESGGEESS